MCVRELLLFGLLAQDEDEIFERRALWWEGQTDLCKLTGHEGVYQRKADQRNNLPQCNKGKGKLGKCNLQGNEQREDELKWIKATNGRKGPYEVGA